MLATGDLADPHRTLTARIAHSATRMNVMVGDLLDFTRSRLCSGMSAHGSGEGGVPRSG